MTTLRTTARRAFRANGLDRRVIMMVPLETVAQLIIQPGADQCVGYRDGDRTNLRRDNLCVTAGWAKGRKGAALVADQEEAEGGDAGAATDATLVTVLTAIAEGGGPGIPRAIRVHARSSA